MDLPSAITITRIESYLDGGTTVVGSTGDNGQRFVLQFNQATFDYRFPKLFWLARTLRRGNALPGRILLNGRLLPPRSQVEERVLSLLLEAKIAADDPDTHRLLEELVAFVRSDVYLAIAKTGRIPIERKQA